MQPFQHGRDERHRDSAADAADAATAGTRTGRPPSALATSDTVTTPSPAMLYAPGGAGAVAASAIASATSSWWTSCNGIPGSGATGFNIGATLEMARTGAGS